MMAWTLADGAGNRRMGRATGGWGGQPADGAGNRRMGRATGGWGGQPQGLPLRDEGLDEYAR